MSSSDSSVVEARFCSHLFNCLAVMLKERRMDGSRSVLGSSNWLGASESLTEALATFPVGYVSDRSGEVSSATTAENSGGGSDFSDTSLLLFSSYPR